MDGNKIQLLDQKNQKVGTITNIEIQNFKPIIKHLDALRALCILYEKENSSNTNRN
jgi:hypothetical protein